MEERHASARLVRMMGKCFPIQGCVAPTLHYVAQPALSFKIIEALFQVFSRSPCVMSAKQDWCNPLTRMNTSVPQISGYLYLYLYIHIYKREYLLGGVYFFFLVDFLFCLPFGLCQKTDIGRHISPHRQYSCGLRPYTHLVSRTLGKTESG